jgi:poly-beta-1,6-N-acetyl-D-glucosamine synthase
MDYIDELIYYVQFSDMAGWIRMFWLFFFFELLRFFLVDLIILIAWRFKWLFIRRYEKINRSILLRANPLVSIIIPGKNEGENIYKLVQSLQLQTYRNFEIIVVDDGSDDNTPMIGRSLEQSGLINYFFRNEVRGGKASAANLGFRASKGDIIVHLDADCTMEPDAIENIILPFFMQKNIGAVGGNIVVRNYKRSLCTSLQGIEYIDSISIGRIVASELGIYRMVSGAFGAFTREGLTRVGGWDIGPGLDGDITVRLRKLGYNIRFAPAAVCYTDVPVKFKGLVKQRLRWDRSFVRFRLRKHRDVFFPTRSFRFSNFISFAENLTYSFILDIKWFIYFFDLLFNYSHVLQFIIPMNYLLYLSAYYLKFLVFYFFRINYYEKPATYFLKYIPCMPLYFGYFLRFVRTTAYIQELLFKKSYTDKWNPLKTSRHAKRLRI